MFDIKSGIRKRSEAEQLQTVTIADMISTVGATDFNLVENKEGIEYLHLVGEDDQYLTVKVGQKCNLTETGPARIKELVNDYVVYAGKTDNGPWFTFGPEPVSNEPVATISVASLFGAANKVN